MSETFRAFRIVEEEGSFTRSIVQREKNELPKGDLLIKVLFSSLNYKDALSCIGNKGVTRNYPHTPGIDAAGIVEESQTEQFSAGDEVIVTGYDLGMNTDGGFGEYIRVPAEWAVKKPPNLPLEESMMFGTAGFTAALSVYKLLLSVNKDAGEVLVTGGTGGVATIASKILVKLGYNVVVTTGKADVQKDALMQLGVQKVLPREEVEDTEGKPMLKSRWAGVIDTVGGNMLASVLKTTAYNGVVTTCGNVGGDKFQSYVYPFILRGITLYGVDSVQCPRELRSEIWNLLSDSWKPENLDSMIKTIGLEALDQEVSEMLQGSHSGRAILKHDHS
ncbi:MAG: acryloyl-CoA reductase [Tindallia sp. MSAO_Bac2]|nr:MAG: acryloyl-CoA reductase [Tindallia sp. MSAO_Bac2]